VLQPVFIDTAGWASFFLESETCHDLAETLLRGVRSYERPAITTNYVLAKLSALLISPPRVSHSRRLEFIERAMRAPWIEVVHIESELDSRSWDFLARHRDKDFSLVDCSSFLVMKEMAISAAITTDRHFEQAGFQCLLR
jgi:predicted nucleic acid-binding protein